MSDKPATTRLRWVRSKDPDTIVEWTQRIGVRVQIYQVLQAKDGKWYVWFVPGDQSTDLPSGDLDNGSRSS